MLPLISCKVFRRNALRTLLLWIAVLQAAAAAADEADDQFAVAAGLYARQQWELAVEAFGEFLAKHPDHPNAAEATFFLGEALLQTGKVEQAGERFRQYLAAEPEGKFARPALFRAGEAAYLTGSPQVAKTELEQFLATYADDKLNAYVLPYLGDIALGQGDTDSAAKYFRAGLAPFSQGRLQDDCRFGLARALERQGENEEAERLYLAVAAKRGNALADDAQFHLGALQYAIGRYDEAVETFAAFEGRFAQSPWQAQARLGRGWALVKLRRLAEAKPVFQSLSGDAALGIEARYWLGLTQKAEEDWAAAAATLLAAAKADPEHRLVPLIRYHAGDALRRANDPAAAIEQFDLVIAGQGPDNQWADEAMHGKIHTALEAGDHAAVDRAADQFEQRFPDSPLKNDVRRMRAQSLLKRDRHAEAVKLLEPLVAVGILDEQGMIDRYLLVQAYEGLGRYEDALAGLLPVLDAAQGQLKADAQLTHGSLLLALQRYSDAIRPFEAFLDGKPTGEAAVKARGELAICYARADRLDDAKAIYAALLEEQPQHDLIGPITEQLAEAAYAAKDQQWSAELFARLSAERATDQNQWKGLSGLGWSQFKAGRLEEAAATFEELLEKKPPEDVAAEAAMVRGQILRQLGRSDAALAMYDLVIDEYSKAPQHAQALWAAARLRDSLQQDQQAAALYERLSRDHPGFPEPDAVLYQWAWALDDLGKTAESTDLFERLRQEHLQSRYWADAVFRLAQRAFGAKDYERAERLVAEVLTGQKDSRIREHALYLRGQIAVVKQDWEEVGKAFQALAKEFPESPMRLVAEYWVADVAYRQRDFQEAGRRFDRLATQIQGRRQPWLAMIPLRRAQVLGQLDRWNEAYTVASKIRAEYPNFEQQYEADYLIGRCLHARADFQGARDAFQKVIRSPHGAKTETAAMAQWMIGETYFHQKNYEAALREYLRLEILYAYPTWQAAALLQAGKCHEHLGEWKEAGELYARLLKAYPNTPFAEHANQRLQALSRQRLETAQQID